MGDGCTKLTDGADQVDDGMAKGMGEGFAGIMRTDGHVHACCYTSLLVVGYGDMSCYG